MESSQEAYVTIKYRLENNGSEPKLNDIGVRQRLGFFLSLLCSEPKLNDIGVRRNGRYNADMNGSEPKLNDIGVRRLGIVSLI